MVERLALKIDKMEGGNQGIQEKEQYTRTTIICERKRRVEDGLGKGGCCPGELGG